MGPAEILMVYSILGHPECKLENNEDFQVMFLLAAQLRLHHVNVCVSSRSSHNQLVVMETGGLHSDYERDTIGDHGSHVDWRMELHQQIDLLLTF